MTAPAPLCPCGAPVEVAADWVPAELPQWPGPNTECRRCAYRRWLNDQLALPGLGGESKGGR